MKKILLAAALLGLVSAGCNKTADNNSQNQNQNQNSTPLDAQNSNNSSQAQQNSAANTPNSNTGRSSASDSTPANSGLHFSSGSDAEAPTPEVVGVDITANGFSPSTVTIKQGDYVQFTNRDTQPHLPASNPHPTHTDYPGFQAPSALKTGQIYRFQFTKVGTWGYHDHLNPSVGGTIIVQPL